MSKEAQKQPLQQHDVSRSFTLQFFGIEDLIRKTERLKAAHKIQSETVKETLRQNAIQFNEIGDYAVAIDIGLISEDKLDVIKKQDTTFLDSVYEELNVIKNCV